MKANHAHKSQNDYITVNNKYLNRQNQQDSDELQRQQQNKLFGTFLVRSGKGKDLDYYRININTKLENAKLLTQAIEQCQTNILYIKKKLELCGCHTEKVILIKEIEEQQDIYKKVLEEMKLVKDETTRLEFGLKQTEIRATQEFSMWLENTASNQSVVNNFSKNNCCQYDDDNISQLSQIYYFTPEYHNYFQNFDNNPYNNCSIYHSTENDNFCCSNNKIQSYHKSSCFKNVNLEERRYSLQESWQNNTSYCPASNINICGRNTPLTYNNNMFNPSNICGCEDDPSNASNAYKKHSKYDYQFTLNSDHGFVSNETSRTNFIEDSNNSNTTMSSIQVTCDNKSELSKNMSSRKDSSPYKISAKRSKCKKVDVLSQLDTIPESVQIDTVLTNSTLVNEKVSKETGRMKDESETTEKLLSKNQQYGCQDLKYHSSSENVNIVTDTSLQNRNLSNTTIINQLSKPEDDLNGNHQIHAKNMFDEGDSESFKEFVGTLELTGDDEIDQEIVKFYRMKFV